MLHFRSAHASCVMRLTHGLDCGSAIRTLLYGVTRKPDNTVAWHADRKQRRANNRAYMVSCGRSGKHHDLASHKVWVKMVAARAAAVVMHYQHAPWDNTHTKKGIVEYAREHLMTGLTEASHASCNTHQGLCFLGSPRAQGWQAACSAGPACTADGAHRVQPVVCRGGCCVDTSTKEGVGVQRRLLCCYLNKGLHWMH